MRRKAEAGQGVGYFCVTNREGVHCSFAREQMGQHMGCRTWVGQFHRLWGSHSHCCFLCGSSSRRCGRGSGMWNINPLLSTPPLVVLVV